MNLAVLDRSRPVPLVCAVARYNRDVGKSSSLGALYAGRQGDGYANDVYGVDGFYRFDDSNTLSFQYLRSETLYPEAITSDPDLDQRIGSSSGDALGVKFNHQSRHWVALFDYHDFDPDFRADSGFIPQVDLSNAHLLLLRQSWGDEDDWYTRAIAGTNLTRAEDHDGRLTNEWIEVFANVSGPLQSFFELAYSERKERIRDVLHEDMSFFWLITEVQPSGAFVSLAPEAIAAGTDIPVSDVVAILERLERRMRFLWRDQEGRVTWAYPVTAEATPHHMAFGTGERLDAA